MAGSDKDRGKSRRLGAEDRGWSSIGRVPDSQTIEWSDDAVCGLGLPSKLRSTVYPQNQD
jgi:hypothetical protein